MISASALIVAGGKGERMNSELRKQYLFLEDLPILSHTVLAFDSSRLIHKIYLVVPEADFDFCHKHILSPLDTSTDIHLVAGGNERQESVYNGLSAMNDTEDIVLIHDGVRPFVSREQIKACIQTADEEGACIIGMPAVDTLKQVDSDTCITRTLERSDIWQAQTPQAFQYRLIKEAHDHSLSEEFAGTDDASLVEHLGKRVKVIPGTVFNIKITTPEDLIIARAIFNHIRESL